MVVALLVLELVELVWHRWVSVTSFVEEGWLAGVVQLEDGGDVGAGAVGIRSQGAVIWSAGWEKSAIAGAAEITVWSWVELSNAMLTGAADSGSAVTVLVGFGCALRMVSGGDAQELAVVGGFAMVVEF